MLVCKRETRLFSCNVVKFKSGKKFEMLIFECLLTNPKSVLKSPNDVQALFTQGLPQMTKTIVNVQW